MTPTDYAEFVTTVQDMVRVNDLAALMPPRVPAQRSASERIWVLLPVQEV